MLENRLHRFNIFILYYKKAYNHIQQSLKRAAGVDLPLTARRRWPVFHRLRGHRAHYESPCLAVSKRQKVNRGSAHSLNVVCRLTLYIHYDTCYNLARSRPCRSSILRRQRQVFGAIKMVRRQGHGNWQHTLIHYTCIVTPLDSPEKVPLQAIAVGCAATCRAVQRKVACRHGTPAGG